MLFRFTWRLVEKSVLSGVFDLGLRVLYMIEELGRLTIESRSERVIEVSDASAPLGSAARDHRFLWGLNHYWRILQTDDGLYVECEALVLSRPMPFMLGWSLHGQPRESLIRTIRATIRIMNSSNAGIEE